MTSLPGLEQPFLTKGLLTQPLPMEEAQSEAYLVRVFGPKSSE